MSNNPLPPTRATVLPEPSGAPQLAVTIEEVTGLGMVSLRGSGDKSFAGVVLTATGLALPEVRKFTANENNRLLWMSPDEWLLFCPHENTAQICADLEKGLNSQHAAVIDVSDARVILSIRGESARDVLMKGSPIDLHPDQFKPGDLRRTQFNEIPAAHIMIADNPPEFHLIAFRSYARHIFDYLTASARPDAMVNLL